MVLELANDTAEVRDIAVSRPTVRPSGAKDGQ
jgi:hypothetical protein